MKKGYTRTLIDEKHLVEKHEEQWFEYTNHLDEVVTFDVWS